MPLKDFTKEEIEQIVKDSTSLSEVARRLNYHSRGVILYTIKNYMIKNNIDFSHFTGRAKGVIKGTFNNIFKKNAIISQQRLRRWYLKGEYTPYICSICGREPIWEGKPLTLRLDHINGYNKDNRLENLRWVCPNCDSQLETFTGRNIRHGMKIEGKKYYCSDCGKEVTRRETKRCDECQKAYVKKLSSMQEDNGIYYIKNKNQIIYRDELKDLIRNNTFRYVGDLYGVTDNAIRKWCIRLKLPIKATEIKKISDEDWEKL